MGNSRALRGVARVLVHVVAIATSWLMARSAGAFCRTTTCPLPADFDPSVEGSCYPVDFAQYCQSLERPSKALPLWWRNACVSYDLQQDVTSNLSYATAAAIVDQSFAKWSTISCDGDGVSIAAMNLGPVACDKVEYNSDQGNQHVIVFRNPWPHENDRLNALGLTTVTFDADTGEIYDADTEINASMPLSVDGLGTYDFESIITHEAGHFLGLAHSVNSGATMYAHYVAGSTTMRTLSTDDIDGICSVYPPDGTRAVDPSVTPSGAFPEDRCDPTPRHGFSPQCAPGATGCSVAASGAARGTSRERALVLGVLLLGAASPRRRRWIP
jgi:hypothetical protein